MPFARVEITTQRTPNLSPPETKAVSELGQEAFWPHTVDKTTGGPIARPFMFNLIAHDREGRELHFKLPLLFVSQARTESDLTTLRNGTDKRQDGYNKPATILSDELRVAQLNGQSIAFARPDKPSDTSFEAAALRFEVMNLPGEGRKPPFYPKLAHAAIKVPALQRLMSGVAEDAGSKRLGGDSLVYVRYSSAYQLNEFPSSDTGDNAGQVLFEFVDEGGSSITKNIDFLAKGAPRLGLVAPKMAIQGLSRSHGPVGVIAQAAKGIFDPATLFDETLDNYKLLGVVSLSKIIGSTAFADAPKLTSFATAAALVTELEWNQSTLEPSKPFIPHDGAALSLNVTVTTPRDGSAPIFDTRVILKNFDITFFDLVMVKFETLEFSSHNGSKPDVNAVLRNPNKVEFIGDLAFVQILADKLPHDGFQDPPFLDVTSEGISAGYTLALPTVALGMFSLQNIAILAALNLPFNGDPASLQFQFAKRDRPFLLSVSGFTGGGFLALNLGLDKIHEIEFSLEFGGSLSLDLIVASGAVAIMGGIYLKKSDGYKIKGYLRISGAMEVLGLICISVEFNMQLTREENGRVVGKATLKVEIEIVFFSKTVTLSVEREFKSGSSSNQGLTGFALLGSGFDNANDPIPGAVLPEKAPTFVDLIKEEHWAAYCAAF